MSGMVVNFHEIEVDEQFVQVGYRLGNPLVIVLSHRGESAEICLEADVENVGQGLVNKARLKEGMQKIRGGICNG